MRRGIVLTVAVLACLLSACALNPPRIVSISPSRDVTDVPTNQAISISFDRPMNHDSVEKRFQLSPALTECAGSRNCRFAWSGNTLTFIHTHVNFELSTGYTVAMHSGYADASGQQNTLEHSWRFTTEGRPMLTSVDPGDGAASVAPDRNIILSFNRAMRPDTMRAAVQLSPGRNKTSPRSRLILTSKLVTSSCEPAPVVFPVLPIWATVPLNLRSP